MARRSNFWKPVENGLRGLLRTRANGSLDHAVKVSSVRILVVVEGANDIDFLTRISSILHAVDPRLPDLGRWEREGKLIFIPFGGGAVELWTHRLAELAQPEFHLYDQEDPPMREDHRRAADAVNRRDGCAAMLTDKRAIENYLDPNAIREARDIDVTFGDHDDVGDRIACQYYRQRGGLDHWDEVPARKKRRLRARVKRWLNTEAVDRMTADRLAERDPRGEVKTWLQTIARLADGEK